MSVFCLWVSLALHLFSVEGQLDMSPALTGGARTLWTLPMVMETCTRLPLKRMAF